jgi:hypothetical protein
MEISLGNLETIGIGDLGEIASSAKEMIWVIMGINMW